MTSIIIIIIFLLGTILNINGMCHSESLLNHKFDEHEEWTQCFNQWALTLNGLITVCHIPDNVMSELIINMAEYPEKTWQLFSLCIRCKMSITFCETLLIHIEKCCDHSYLRQ